ncbi:Do family serine endopeptidase [Bartonella sp. HY329]|uniref:Do family serine endopeptidase n=1 Tax=unclassified Bartonella TaxID=2645622 RepID=UPI0021C7EA22|nr:MULTISPECIES: Do family serine endopeptidase [unclassified Bartonella]UXM94059.1 Do family serine endopeptidase [Bartonella sp. HY329]UXN08381.1 Do family serine endopeptidase [Bartonella sp. HY328]
MTKSSRFRFAHRFLSAVSLSTIMLGSVVLSGPLTFSSAALADPVFVEGPKQTGFADVVDKVKPAVVSVQVKSDARPQEADGPFFGGPDFDQLPDGHPLKRFFRDFQGGPFGPDGPRGPHAKPGKPGKPDAPGRMRPVSQGSGFFISEDGYVVTNNHVVSDGSAYVVVLDDGTELDAKLIGTDPRTDLAVIKVDSDRKFPYVGFADDNKTRVGDWVVAVGNPFGLGGTVTAGIVSARGRDIGASVYDDFIQIDAAVNKGNSGGPTFNLNGQVVGINTAIFSPSGGNVGIAFAIPATTAQQVVNQLIEHGKVQRGWLGVQIQPVTKEIADSLGLKEAKGALIADPMDGPAAKAGIKASDVIVSVNDEPVNDARDLARKIAAIAPNEKVTLGVWREGKKENIEVTIAAMPSKENGGAIAAKPDAEADDSLNDYGLTVTPAEDGKGGVVVTDVDRDSDAAEKGIRPGDIIRQVNSQDVASAQDIVKAITEAVKAGRLNVALRVETDNKSRFVPIIVKAK